MMTENPGAKKGTLCCCAMAQLTLTNPAFSSPN